MYLLSSEMATREIDFLKNSIEHQECEDSTWRKEPVVFVRSVRKCVTLHLRDTDNSIEDTKYAIENCLALTCSDRLSTKFSLRRNWEVDFVRFLLGFTTSEEEQQFNTLTKDHYNMCSVNDSMTKRIGKAMTAVLRHGTKWKSIADRKGAIPLVNLLDDINYNANPLTHHAAGRIFAAMINGNDKQRFFVDIYMYDTWFPEEFNMPWDIFIGCHQGHSNLTVTPSEVNHRLTEVECYSLGWIFHVTDQKFEKRLFSLCHAEGKALYQQQRYTQKKSEDCAWTPVVDEELLKFLESVEHKPGWYPYQNGHAQVNYRAKALRTPDPYYSSKQYYFRTSIVKRKGVWWLLEMNVDMRKEKNQSALEEEAEILVSIFLPAERTYLATVPQLTPEVVEELLEHFMDPVNGSNAKGRKTIGMCCLHVDDLFITGTPEFLEKFKKKVRANFKIGHEDVNDLMFTGQRVKWQLDEKTKKKSHIAVEQSLCVSELTEIVITRGQKDEEKCDKDMHTAYRSLLGSIHWLQSRTQFQACYQFSRCASAAASPTIGDCKALNKLCEQIVNDPMELKFWPLEGNPRLMAMPDAAFRNNSDKSSQRAMVIFMSEPRKEKSRNSRGSLIFFESTKIKRTTLSTTVAELYALMKCYGTCQMLRGLIKDITSHSCEIHMRTDANNLVTTASTTHVPEQQETIHMIQMLRKEACSGAIADLSHIRTQWCLADCLTKKSANPQALIDAVRQGILKEVDAHPPFRTLVEHKAYLRSWLPTVCHHVNFALDVFFLAERFH